MKAIVSGWMEVAPQEGATTHLLHLVNGAGKKACRCRYGQGSSAAVAKPHTVPVVEEELVRGEDGHLSVGIAGNIIAPKVVLCDKSEKALREELTKWKAWEG